MNKIPKIDIYTSNNRFIPKDTASIKNSQNKIATVFGENKFSKNLTSLEHINNLENSPFFSVSNWAADLMDRLFPEETSSQEVASDNTSTTETSNQGVAPTSTQPPPDSIKKDPIKDVVSLTKIASGHRSLSALDEQLQFFKKQPSLTEEKTANALDENTITDSSISDYFNTTDPEWASALTGQDPQAFLNPFNQQKDVSNYIDKIGIEVDESTEKDVIKPEVYEKVIELCKDNNLTVNQLSQLIESNLSINIIEHQALEVVKQVLLPCLSSLNPSGVQLESASKMATSLVLQDLISRSDLLKKLEGKTDPEEIKGIFEKLILDLKANRGEILAALAIIIITILIDQFLIGQVVPTDNITENEVQALFNQAISDYKSTYKEGINKLEGDKKQIQATYEEQRKYVKENSDLIKEDIDVALRIIDQREAKKLKQIDKTLAGFQQQIDTLDKQVIPKNKDEYKALAKELSRQFLVNATQLVPVILRATNPVVGSVAASGVTAVLDALTTSNLTGEKALDMFVDLTRKMELSLDLKSPDDLNIKERSANFEFAKTLIFTEMLGQLAEQTSSVALNNVSEKVLKSVVVKGVLSNLSGLIVKPKIGEKLPLYQSKKDFEEASKSGNLKETIDGTKQKIENNVNILTNSLSTVKEECLQDTQILKHKINELKLASKAREPSFLAKISSTFSHVFGVTSPDTKISLSTNSQANKT